MSSLRTYLALGDSMSIDFYTRVRGGGATSQLHRRLGAGWMLDDRTEDGCVIARAPRDGHGHLITLTVGGNDLRVRAQEILEDRFAAFRDAHLALLRAVRQANPKSVFLVANVYRPQRPLPPTFAAGLRHANEIIATHVEAVGAHLVDVYRAFDGHEDAYLCENIEPTHQGATVIADLFAEAWSAASGEAL